MHSAMIVPTRLTLPRDSMEHTEVRKKGEKEAIAKGAAWDNRAWGLIP